MSQCPKAFFEGYVDCALWCGVLGPDGPDPHIYDLPSYRIAFESLAKMRADCDSFYDANESLLGYEIEDSQAGHDFWLTRNRHGAGFWDRGLGETGDKLTEAAHAFGEAILYLDDDGHVQVM
jgi:hypothetical protein